MKRLFALCLLLLAGGLSADPFGFTSQSVVYRPHLDQFVFSVHLNQAPDFTTTDDRGRPLHRLGWWFSDRLAFTSPALPGEIALTGRTMTPQGWGPPLANLPFTLTPGHTLRWSVPSALILPAFDPDQMLFYRLESYTYGAMTGLAEGQFPMPVPEGSPLLTLALFTICLLPKMCHYVKCLPVRHGKHIGL